MSGYTDAHNDWLDEALDSLQSAHPEVELVSLDIFGLFEDVLDSFDVTDRGIIEGCLFNPDACNPGDETGMGFVFWDEQHPTTETHARFATAAAEAVGLRQVADAPEPQTLLVLASGLLLILAVRCRKSVAAGH